MIPVHRNALNIYINIALKPDYISYSNTRECPANLPVKWTWLKRSILPKVTPICHRGKEGARTNDICLAIYQLQYQGLSDL